MRRHRLISRLSLLIVGALLSAALPRTALAQDAPPAKVEFRDGDRVVLLGAAFIERLQQNNYLESLLTAAQPDRQVEFRNLGWSGDTVQGISRAVFGSPQDGFKRLLNDVTQAEPTLILVCYGDNEANRGEAGLPDFTAGLNGLLDALEKTSARVALLSPLEREKLGPPLPSPEKYNQSLALYRDALRKTAADRGLAYVELNPLVPQTGNTAGVVKNPVDQLTSNTLHLTPYGHWRAAPVIAARLGVGGEPWSIGINAAATEQAATGVAVASLSTTQDSVQFEATDRRLPYPSPPQHAPAGAALVAPQRLLQVEGLAAGVYELTIDGQPAARADAAAWAAGVQLTAGPQFAQVEQLRQTIAVKNELYFHRYRPQNETYLFLFRKHEQGNNAVEIPQFEPLVEEKEKEIAQLRVPKKHKYKLTRVAQ